MKPVFVGVAGGTGAGKSTVCFAMADKYPGQITIIHLDDYHKKRVAVPMLHGMTNWDHPEAIDIDLLLRDLAQIGEGKTITIRTKNERDNPNYNGDNFGRIEMEFYPSPLILFEGYLLLWYPQVRELLARSIYLDAPHGLRLGRRTKFVDAEYNEKVLIPMQEEFVEPTKQYATDVIDISSLTLPEVCNRVEQIIEPFLKK